MISSITRDIEKKFTQLVKNHEDVKWSPKKLPALPCIAMQKFDGVCALAVISDGKCELYSRTGKRLKNVEHLEEMLSGTDLREVFCVEVCHSELSLEQISGVVNPKRVEPLEFDFREAWLGVYDVLPLEDFVKGRSSIPFYRRIAWAMKSNRDFGLNLVLPVHTVCETEEEVTEFHSYMLERGEEGTVRCQPEADWVAGRRSEAKTKKVRGVDYDLEVVGVVEGKGKRAGTLGKVLCRWRKFGKPDGKLVELPIDVCMTDIDRDFYWAFPNEIIGKVVHVHGLQVGSQGSIRLAKVKEIRFDKIKGDF